MLQGGDAISAGGGGDLDNGTILYIDPNDPHSAELLQQAGLRLADDGTVTSLAPDAVTDAVTSLAAETVPAEAPVASSPSKILGELTEAAITTAVSSSGIITTASAPEAITTTSQSVNDSPLPAHVAELLATPEILKEPVSRLRRRPL